MNYKYIKFKVFRLDGGASLTTDKTNELAKLKKKLEMAQLKKRKYELQKKLQSANLKKQKAQTKLQAANLKKQKAQTKVPPIGLPNMARLTSIPKEDINTYNKYLDIFDLPDLSDKFMKYYQLKRYGRLAILENNTHYAFLNIHHNTIKLTPTGLYINFKFNNQICTLTFHKSGDQNNRIHLKNLVTKSNLPIKVKMNQYGPDETDYEFSIIDQQPSIFFTIAKNLINILNEFYKKLNEWRKLSTQEQIKLNYYW